MTEQVQITSASRLHFGLMDVQEPFGGIGAMIDCPTTLVKVSRSSRFRCNGWFHRIYPVVRRVFENANLDIPQEFPDESFLALPIQVDVMSRAPSHLGLGSGTSLAMAVAEATLAILSASQVSDLPIDSGSLYEQALSIMNLAGRGRRSRIGAIGYLTGGFVFETGDDDSQECGPAATVIDVPDQWRALVFRPSIPTKTIHGDEENACFSALSPASDRLRQSMLHRIETEVLPSLHANDLDGFGEAIYQHNRDSGGLFSKVQNGVYRNDAIAELIDVVRHLGVKGVGQSSWGPGVFAICRDDDHADWLINAVVSKKKASLVCKARFQNQGRQTVDQDSA